MVVLLAECWMRVARRFWRVSSRLALMTHQVAARRYQGGWVWKKVQACGFD